MSLFIVEDWTGFEGDILLRGGLFFQFVPPFFALPQSSLRYRVMNFNHFLGDSLHLIMEKSVQSEFRICMFSLKAE